MYTITPAVFADKLGVQRSNVSHVLSGRNKPGLDFLEKIILQFPRVNAHWLITGEMQASSTIEAEVKEKPTSDNPKEIDKNRSAIISGENLVKIVEFYTDGTFKEYLPVSSHVHGTIDLLI